MTRFNHLSAFSKASILLITSLFSIGLSIPYVMAESTGKDVGAEAPSDADFKKLDMNSDAKISFKEAVKDKILATNFDMTDANKNGNISSDEYAGYKAALQMSSPEAAPAANPVN